MAEQHWLIVTQVERDDGDDSRFEEYEIEHPGCKIDHEIGAYECPIGFEEYNGGDIRWTLNYSGTPVDKPGRYPIVFWHHVIRGFDYTEHDVGIAVGYESERVS